MSSFLKSLRGGWLLVAAVIGVGLVVAFGRMATMAFTEILWHAEVGYLDAFWRRVLWEWGGRILAGLGVGVLVFFNLRIVSATLGGIQIKRRFGNLEISEQLPRSYVLITMVGISALLAAWFGAAVPRSVGLQTLLLKNAPSWGLVEPILGRDVGFYVFLVPVLGSVITFALVITFLLFTLAAGGYAATGALRWDRGRVDAQQLPRAHLGVLLAVFFLLMGARLWLGRYLLLLDGNSGVQGIFGFADAEARLPALQTLTVVSVMAAAATFWSAWRNRVVPLAVSAVAVVVAAIVIGQFFPALVQRFRVEPNELERETPYIEHNLAFTRVGFGLEDVDLRRFEYLPEEAVDWARANQQFEGLPVWNQGALLTTFQELEARFPYYDFSSVTVDRYPSPRGPVPVAVSVREVDPGGIQDPNWQNLHLRELYVGGMGAVASLASGRSPEGRPRMLISGIPPERAGDPESMPALGLDRPQVFFGARPQMHAVINPGESLFLSADGGPGVVNVDFPAGIELSSSLRMLAMAWRFRDANLLFASEVTERSRFVFRRRVLERVQAIAPFLRYFEAPYPVVADGRIVWILEGFTATRAFPLSSAHERQFLRSVTYVRNSVKITVDAVTGQVDLYRVPVPDPYADTYAAAFPGLFKPISEMPRSLKSHVRYSKELLSLQAQVLLQYHQETAPAFHGQRDVWSLPQELAEGTSPVPYRPEYGIWALPGEEARFQLTTVFVPAGRQNLTAILVARTDDDGVPELVQFDVPVEDQVPGPRQIEALVEQDPQISQEFSLWRTGGSEVWTGHLHLVPVGGRLLYLEPVFLAAEADAIPELRRFVVSDGRRVVMAESLQGAVAELAGSAALAPPAVEGAGTRRTDAPVGSAWPTAALDLLAEAEARLREGDWAGFGAALAELRALLQELERTGGGGGR
jgi:uncharacterized membrane protein (UPF0182 family)